MKVGDIIQFDWQPSASNPSDRDHTGIVTKIETGVDGTITVRYTAHTDPDNDPKVDQSIEASLADYGHDINGLVYFISIP
ncbi:CHAP domain-containing protein [Leifsonia sp. YAF41]|uniref:CHAP domain-containing protein n=1 Tax=Leifsonia sp. YAF41 TaxID=3233086 RepID=UPI003F96DEC6